MAFFGLTALGASDTFKAEYKNGCLVDLFALEEFGEAYDDVLAHQQKKAARAGIDVPKALTLGDVPDVFRIVYHGPPPAGELDRAAAVFAEGTRDVSMPLPKELFLAGMEVLQETAPDVIAKEKEKAAHYDSFDMLRQHRQKGTTAESGPLDCFARPLTLAQDIGSHGNTMTVDKRYPKRQCAETKFAALLRASGY